MPKNITLFEKNSDPLYMFPDSDGELIPNSDEIVPVTKVFIKEEQPETEYSSVQDDLNCDVNELESNGMILFNKIKSEHIKEKQVFIKDEWESNETFSAFVEETPEELDKALLHEELDIKDENEIEPDNKTVDGFHTSYATSPNLQESAKQSTRCSNLNTRTTHSELKEHHKAPFVCGQCAYNCLRIDQLKQHQMKHSGERPFVCDHCDYKTIYSNCLKKHQLKHSGVKPFACNQCEYKTVKADHLRRHQMKHSGKKPFTCNQCDYSTLYLYDLRKHQMGHLGEKPFGCDQCDYKTVYSCALKQHKMKHSGEKPFACDLCRYKAVSSDHLRRHHMTHSGEKPFACDQCDYKAADSGNFKRHQRKHAAEKMCI